MSGKLVRLRRYEEVHPGVWVMVCRRLLLLVIKGGKAHVRQIDAIDFARWRDKGRLRFIG